MIRMRPYTEREVELLNDLSSIAYARAEKLARMTKVSDFPEFERLKGQDLMRVSESREWFIARQYHRIMDELAAEARIRVPRSVWRNREGINR